MTSKDFGAQYGACDTSYDSDDVALSSTSSDCSSVINEPINHALRTDSTTKEKFGVVAAVGMFCFALIYMTGTSSNQNYLSFLRLGYHFKASQSNGDSVFLVNSTSFVEGESLDKAFTCAGDSYKTSGETGISPALSWYNAPEGTQEFMVMMTTNYYSKDNPDEKLDKYDWVIYSIPNNVRSLSEGEENVGTFGGSYPSRPAYYYKSPCSTNGGLHNYTFTVFALSGAIVEYINYSAVALDLHSWSDGYEPDDHKQMDDDGSGVTAPFLIDAMSTLLLDKASTFVRVDIYDDDAA